MRKKLLKIAPIILLVLLCGVVFMPNVAMAGWQETLGCIMSPVTCAVKASTGGNLIIELFAALGNVILWLVSWLLTLAGVVLNISIILTMNIKAIYQATPAIEQTWIVIRNISSIFIILGLLYISILTILDVGKPNMKQWIFNIILAGVLINFSLFFTKVLIDASNLVSMQFYRAIAPKSQNVSLTDERSISSLLSTTFDSGGISDVFMQSLKIPTIFNNNKGLITTDSNKTFFTIAASTFFGSILIIIAAASFFAAALAFIMRLVVLLLLMAFSPLYFVGWIFPRIKSEMSDLWMKHFQNQLIFMPVYLFFMYVALRFISSDVGKGFLAALDTGRINVANGATVAAGGVLMSTVGLLLQYTIALILINIPLIAALELGAIAPKWAGGVKDWAGNLTKMVGSAAGRNTIGRTGKFVGEKFDNMAAAAQGSVGGRRASTVLRTLGISQAVRGTLGSIEKGKYGYQNLEDVEKADKERSKVVSGVQRSKIQKDHISKVVGSRIPPTPTQLDDFRKTVSGMDIKELEKLKIETLSDPALISALPSSKFDSLMKSDALTPQQQQDLRTAREKGFENILAANGPDYLLKTVSKGKPGEIAKLPGKILTNPNVALQLDPASLRKMIDENVGQADRDVIRNTIVAHVAGLPAGTPPTSTVQKAHTYLTTGPGQTLF